MLEFSLATGQTAADFAQGIGVGHVAEQHGNQLRPAGESLGAPFRLVLRHEFGEFGPGKVMKQLTKQTRYLYHDHALYGNFGEKFVGAKILHHNSPRGLSV
jgi:hypothetical protein